MARIIKTNIKRVFKNNKIDFLSSFKRLGRASKTSFSQASRLKGFLSIFLTFIVYSRMDRFNWGVNFARFLTFIFTSNSLKNLGPLKVWHVLRGENSGNYSMSLQLINRKLVKKFRPLIDQTTGWLFFQHFQLEPLKNTFELKSMS